jgi:uncharacterized coiled-coil protein SlyX
MKDAFLRAVVLAASAWATICWGQGTALPTPAGKSQVTKLSPAVQVDLLRSQVAALETENSKLKEQVRALTERLNALAKGNFADGRLADSQQRVRSLQDENAALRKNLSDVQNTLEQRESDLQTAQASLQKTLGELKSTQERLDLAMTKAAALEASSADLQQRLAASQTTIESQQRTIEGLQHTLAEAGWPFWPWGALAAAAALVLGAPLTRRLWPRVVRQPLSVNVKLGEWMPRVGPEGLTLTPGFGVRTALDPRFTSIRVTREPLVREVRDARQGVMQ